MKKVKCSHCDVEMSIPDLRRYRYAGVSKNAPYPQISYAWCSDCNKFVLIQKGVEYNVIQSHIKEAYQELIRLEKSFIKFDSTKKEIKEEFSKLQNAIIMNGIADGHSTLDACIECGGTHLVYKDIEQQIWACPKCNKGILQLEHQSSDIRFRIVDGKWEDMPIIHPAIDKNKWYFNIVARVVKCAVSTIRNERAFLANQGTVSGFYKIALAEKESKYLERVVDRVSLIYSMLVKLHELPLTKKTFIHQIMTILAESAKEQSVDEKTLIWRLDKRMEYFLKAAVWMKYSSFNPSSVISVLNNPHKDPDKDITLENEDVEQLKVIKDTIKAYFPNWIMERFRIQELWLFR